MLGYAGQMDASEKLLDPIDLTFNGGSLDCPSTLVDIMVDLLKT